MPFSKQFLITKNVPCLQRVSGLNLATGTEIEVDEGWVATADIPHTTHEEILDIAQDNSASNANEVSKSIPNGEDDFIDLNDLVEEDLSNSVVKNLNISESNVVKSRSYNLSITYDKFYQTPRVYLEGFDDQNRPLSESEIFEDVMQDYQNKTVTIEKHPHLTSKRLQASIHPCRHAKVMKKIVDRLKEGGRAADSNQYLFIFLKFIQSVIPTVDYDYTIQVTAK